MEKSIRGKYLSKTLRKEEKRLKFLKIIKNINRIIKENSVPLSSLQYLSEKVLNLSPDNSINTLKKVEETKEKIIYPKIFN